ncbi:MAG TPA: murein biosynthesis integral membrane protein MurJ [Anaerolineales bacterium]|nr:murein biosynthesis integral membrane protein MurJ [Anaerolineales bacterium]
MKNLSFLTRTSLLLGFFFTLDKVLAFVRSIIIARTFNLSFELDAFNVANNLPDLLFALISGGALGMAFIPVLTEILTLNGRRAAWDLFSRFANLAFIVTGSAALVVAIFAEQIVKAQIGIAPGFNADQQHLIAELMRLNLIATIIFSISGLVMASLQANQHFLLPALAPTLYNVGQIFGALVLAPRFGVHGLVYGVIIGALLHLSIQIPALIKYQFHWTPSIKLDPAVIEALKVVGPRLLTMFMIQSMFIARDNFASRLNQVGAISSLTYGWMIMQVPETLIGTAIATALLPTLSQLAARGDWENFRQTIEKALQILIALTLPAAAIIAAGIHPLVRAAFGFDEAGTNLMTTTARIYMLTLCGYAIQEIAARSFYARREAWYPFFGVVLRMAIYIPIALAALNVFGSIGAPAIAFAELSLTVEAALMLFWLSRKLHEPLNINGALFKGLIAALVGGGTAYALALLLPGSAVSTALIGMIIGTGVALLIIQREVRVLFNL